MSKSGNILQPIQSLSEAYSVRALRNDCRQYMTHDSSYISIPRQKIWYENTYIPASLQKTMSCYLYKIVPDQQVGFGMIRKIGNDFWITGGIQTIHRGKGLGTDLFKVLINEVRSNDVWLDVLATNTIAQHLYKKLKFMTVQETTNHNKEKLLVMKLSKS